MSQEKCNFHYEGREQVWSQIRNCRKEEGEILNDLLREDGIARSSELRRHLTLLSEVCLTFLRG